MLLAAGVALLIIFTLSVATFVFFRSKRTGANLSFVLLTYTVAAWIAANFIGANYDYLSNVEMFIRIDFVLGILMLYLLWLQTAFLYIQALGVEYSVVLRPRLVLLVTILSVVTVIISLFPHTYDTIRSENGTAEIIYGELFIVFVSVMILLAIMSMNYIRLTLKSATGRYLQQVSMMLFGLVVAVVFLAVPNLIIPLITSSEVVNKVFGNVSYIGIMVFIIATSVAIVKHGLFDVRRLVARSLAYVLALLSIALLYGAVIFLLTRSLFPNTSSSVEQNAFNLLVSILLATTFHPLKNFFDKVTNSIFFKDSYNVEEVLDTLGSVISRESRLENVISQSIQVLSKALKSSYIHVLVFNESEKPIFEKTYGKSSKLDISLLLPLLKKEPNPHIEYDLLEDQSVLKEELKKAEISVIARLTTSKKDVGYIVFGNKINGDLYSTKDRNLVAVAVDEMAVAIQNVLRFQEIQEFNRTLQVRIEEATDELKSTNKKLRMIDASKDEFISMASHQLRTPLTSVKGYLSMVLEGDVGKITPEQQKVLEEAYTSSQRMVYLIGDFLNVSRLQTGKFELERSDVQLPYLIADEIEQLKASAKARNTVLQYTPPDQFPILRIDENKIRQVMMNFIDNAIYYSKPGGGMITVTLAKHSKHISFKVIDDGIGVPRSEQHQLFSKFYRASNAKKARPDGTGIGLFMAKKVIVAHGGAILFESKEGEGSTFGFRLPIEPTESI